MTQFYWIGQIQHISLFLKELVSRQWYRRLLPGVIENTPTQWNHFHTRVCMDSWSRKDSVWRNQQMHRDTVTYIYIYTDNENLSSGTHTIAATGTTSTTDKAAYKTKQQCINMQLNHQPALVIKHPNIYTWHTLKPCCMRTALPPCLPVHTL